jgi:hypothetical protein
MTASTIPNTAAEQAINQRLDAIDRALLDLLPRNERLTLVAQVDARVRELVAASASPQATFGSAACPAVADAALSVPGVSPLSPPIVLPSARMPRSRLAISAGLVGIAALILLFATPLTYVFVSFVGELIGEVGSIALLGIHIGMVTLGGLAAVALAIVALFGMSRRRGVLAGHGWAIAGLCTGPLPILGGAAAGLILGMEFVGTPFLTTEMTVSGTCPSEACESSPATYAAPCSLASPGVPVPVATMPAHDPQFVPPDLPQIPNPSVQPPIQPTANEVPATEPETRPEPPGVPQCST